ncbi:fatty acid desaturase [Heyndrickxia acidicola]|uniref:Fatty acid desaturase n=1 Tax=Heyndrickxia acidicola TaxID=209389 RepID=A0ABU6MM45_9BACI|nr:fatty acid desaturase [Heyndrickxia acidicola]MED1205569.1 fatty acid desaturase [Heyndrickxia acidicola]
MKNKKIELREKVKPFEKAIDKRAYKQILNTFLPFLVLWILAYEGLKVSFWLSLPISIINAGFLVRIFIIFHDCTHQSFFKSHKANKILGTICGIFTHFPFEKWKREHSIHHATSGNLDKRGIGDIWMMTVDEFKTASRWTRFAYRLYRNPFVMFVLGPLFLFLIENRFNNKTVKRKERLNTYLINFSLVVIYLILIFTVGWKALICIQVPILFLSGMLGIWLFYVQHQFEDSYFEEQSKWDYVKSAVEGSSFYKLPRILQWLTGNIGYHHVHHLSPRVPNYSLEQAHNSTPPLHHVTTITLLTSLKCLRFHLFNEKDKSFISFKQFKSMTEN